jgi:antitoxin FitA
MPVALSIKNAPDDVVERLRARAASNHRSLQGELLAIIEAAVPKRETADIPALVERIRALNLPQGGESSVDTIRAMRDSR